MLLLAVPLGADDFSYVYTHPDGNTLVSTGNLDEVLRLRKQLPRPSLWARIDGREYVVRDAAVLEEVEKAYGPLAALHGPMEELRTKMRRIEKREERLEDEADALSDSEEKRSAAEETRLRELRRAFREIRDELRPLEIEERRLDDREEALSKVFDGEVERIVRRGVRSGTAERVR
jgi:predicted  nucleic acid-binding Zn-ribbon protein